MPLTVLKKAPLCLALSFSTFALGDVILPQELLNKGYKALPTFEAVATIEHRSDRSKSKENLDAEDFKSLNQDPLFLALSRLEFNYKMGKKAEKCAEESKILNTLEKALNTAKFLDLLQNHGAMIININILNNLSGTLDDSVLKASAFIGNSKKLSSEREPPFNINIILKKDGTCISPSEAQVRAAFAVL